jgi:hypothetical protein
MKEGDIWERLGGHPEEFTFLQKKESGGASYMVCLEKVQLYF